MKKLLFLTLIFLVTSLDTLLEKKQGLAFIAKNGGTISCSDRYEKFFESGLKLFGPGQF